jgi:hypothetical protein
MKAKITAKISGIFDRDGNYNILNESEEIIYIIKDIPEEMEKKINKDDFQYWIKYLNQPKNMTTIEYNIISIEVADEF